MVSASVRDRPRGGEGPDSGEAGNRGSGRSGPSKPVRSAHIITESIEVGVPAPEAFERWTRYEKWQEMFKNDSARPSRRGGRGPRTVRVTSKIGPSSRQWEAEVADTEPGHRIDWSSRGGIKAKGATTFHRIDDRLTKVMVEIEYRPTGVLERIGNLLRMQRRRVRKDLRLFKNFAELHGSDEERK
jgi:uncharacterized membrane protein